MTELSTTPSSSPISLNRGNAAAQIIADLRDQILQGRYPRGSKLPSERELAQWYQVSVPTVREAIRGLSAVCLVEPRHGMGVYVTAAADLMFAMAASTLIELENVQLLEVLDTFEALQGKAVVLACVNASDEELEALVAVLDALDNAPTNADLADHLRTFLTLLAGASHNALISTICSFLSKLFIEIVQDELIGLGPHWREVAMQLSPDRRLLAQALRQRDVARSVALAAEYHQHTKRLVADVLAASGNEAGAMMRRAVKRVRAG
ncbi:MAG TPA: GntR family transcriptional regulator [Caulobacteraceae bacterium]|jgi:GntR family transcriptional repressor for pyruvate dehydrogenase complex|nr:GntR family transcriptional regulator [Caulobacteraceae bacterium]